MTALLVLITLGISAALVILIRRAPDWEPCDIDCGCVDCDRDRAGA